MDNTPLFLTLDEVLQVHAYQVETFGGADSVLDMEKLESAIAMPGSGMSGQYYHEDLAAMAAAYLFHIVQNHAFEDGNKRTGTQAAIIFLEINGYPLDIPEEETESLVLNVAKGVAKKGDIAEFFRKLIREQYTPDRE